MIKKQKTISGWRKKLVEMVAQETGCKIQFNKCPCNTCFHTWACEQLGKELGHNLWEIMLVVRGDYDVKEIIKYRK